MSKLADLSREIQREATNLSHLSALTSLLTSNLPRPQCLVHYPQADELKTITGLAWPGLAGQMQSNKQSTSSSGN